MSVERLRTSLLLRAVAVRVVADTVEGVGKLLMSAGRTVENVSNALFWVEADAGRRYRDLTGLSLPGLIPGESTRHDDHSLQQELSEPAEDLEEDDE